MQFSLFSIILNIIHNNFFLLLFNVFINSILLNPFSVKCSLFFIKLTNDENKIKSACFWVNKLYSLKCGIITSVQSLKDWTEYIPVGLPFRVLTVTYLTSRNYLIFFNTFKYLICNYIANTGNIRKPIHLEWSFAILTEKVYSASENPETQ
jgi:hypothetical protein